MALRRRCSHLLHLEFDGGTDGVHLALQVISRVHQSRELTSLGQTGTQQTRDLWKDTGVKSNTGVINPTVHVTTSHEHRAIKERKPSH